MRELQTVSHRELMEPVVEIAGTGVPCGLPGQGQRIEPGFVLKNRSVLLESEKDEKGLYIGGAGMGGMYLRTPERYEPLLGTDGEILAFRRVQPPSVLEKLAAPGKGGMKSEKRSMERCVN